MMNSILPTQLGPPPRSRHRKSPRKLARCWYVFHLMPLPPISVPTTVSVGCPSKSHCLPSVCSCWFCFELRHMDRERSTHMVVQRLLSADLKKGIDIKKWQNPAGLISCQAIYQPWTKWSGLRRSVEVERQLVVYSTWNRAQIRESGIKDPWEQIFYFYFFLPAWIFCFCGLMYQTDHFPRSTHPASRPAVRGMMKTK